MSKAGVAWIDIAKGIGILLVVGRMFLKPIANHAPWPYVIIMTAGAITASLLASKWIVRKIRMLQYALLGEGFSK